MTELSAQKLEQLARARELAKRLASGFETFLIRKRQNI